MVRILSRLSLGLTIAVLASLAPPAQAAAAPRLISSFEQVTTLLPGAEPSIVGAWGSLAVREVPTRTHRLTYTVDFTAVAAFTTVRFGGFGQAFLVVEANSVETKSGDSCTPSGPIYHCVRTSVKPVIGLIAGLGLWEVGAKASAPIGAAGQVLLRVRAWARPGRAGPGAEGAALWRVRELVFAILACESEPVDPRL